MATNLQDLYKLYSEQGNLGTYDDFIAYKEEVGEESFNSFLEEQIPDLKKKSNSEIAQNPQQLAQEQTAQPQQFPVEQSGELNSVLENGTSLSESQNNNPVTELLTKQSQEDNQRKLQQVVANQPAWEQAEAELSQITPDQIRPDGTLKGGGFLGIIKSHSGNDMTEFSVGLNVNNKDVDVPTLVPTLSTEEIEYLKTEPQLNKPFEQMSPMEQSIIDKSLNFAKEREANGLSYFATPEETPSPISINTTDTQAQKAEKVKQAINPVPVVAPKKTKPTSEKTTATENNNDSLSGFDFVSEGKRYYNTTDEYVNKVLNPYKDLTQIEITNQTITDNITGKSKSIGSDVQAMFQDKQGGIFVDINGRLFSAEHYLDPNKEFKPVDDSNEYHNVNGFIVDNATFTADRPKPIQKDKYIEVGDIISSGEDGRDIQGNAITPEQELIMYKEWEKNKWGTVIHGKEKPEFRVTNNYAINEVYGINNSNVGRAYDYRDSINRTLNPVLEKAELEKLSKEVFIRKYGQPFFDKYGVVPDTEVERLHSLERKAQLVSQGYSDQDAQNLVTQEIIGIKDNFKKAGEQFIDYVLEKQLLRNDKDIQNKKEVLQGMSAIVSAHPREFAEFIKDKSSYVFDTIYDVSTFKNQFYNYLKSDIALQYTFEGHKVEEARLNKLKSAQAKNTDGVNSANSVLQNVGINDKAREDLDKHITTSENNITQNFFKAETKELQKRREREAGAENGNIWDGAVLAGERLADIPLRIASDWASSIGRVVNASEGRIQSFKSMGSAVSDAYGNANKSMIEDEVFYEGKDKTKYVLVNGRDIYEIDANGNRTIASNDINPSAFIGSMELKETGKGKNFNWSNFFGETGYTVASMTSAGSIGTGAGKLIVGNLDKLGKLAKVGSALEKNIAIASKAIANPYNTSSYAMSMQYYGNFVDEAIQQGYSVDEARLKGVFSTIAMANVNRIFPDLKLFEGIDDVTNNVYRLLKSGDISGAKKMLLTAVKKSNSLAPKVVQEVAEESAYEPLAETMVQAGYSLLSGDTEKWNNLSAPTDFSAETISVTIGTVLGASLFGRSGGKIDFSNSTPSQKAVFLANNPEYIQALRDMQGKSITGFSANQIQAEIDNHNRVVGQLNKLPKDHKMTIGETSVVVELMDELDSLKQELNSTDLEASKASIQEDINDLNEQIGKILSDAKARPTDTTDTTSTSENPEPPLNNPNETADNPPTPPQSEGVQEQGTEDNTEPEQVTPSATQQGGINLNAKTGQELYTEGKIEPIRQLGTGDNVYYESKKYRVNDSFTANKILVNINGTEGLAPIAHYEFDTPNEAVFIAKKLESDFPNGVPDAILIDKVIENYKQEYQQASTNNQSNETTQGEIVNTQTEEGQQSPTITSETNQQPTSTQPESSEASVQQEDEELKSSEGLLNDLLSLREDQNVTQSETSTPPINDEVINENERTQGTDIANDGGIKSPVSSVEQSEPAGETTTAPTEATPEPRASEEQAEVEPTPTADYSLTNKKGETRTYTRREDGTFVDNTTNRKASATQQKSLEEQHKEKQNAQAVQTETQNGYTYRRFADGSEVIRTPNGVEINSFVNRKIAKGSKQVRARNASFATAYAKMYGEQTGNQIEKERKARYKKVEQQANTLTDTYITALFYFANNGKVSEDSISEEILGQTPNEQDTAQRLGRKYLKSESMKGFKWATLSNDPKNEPKSIEQISEKLWEESAQADGTHTLDQQEVFDFLNEVLMRFKSAREIQDYLIEEFYDSLIGNGENERYTPQSEDEALEYEYYYASPQEKAIIDDHNAIASLTDEEKLVYFGELYDNDISSLPQQEQNKIYGTENERISTGVEGTNGKSNNRREERTATENQSVPNGKRKSEAEGSKVNNTPEYKDVSKLIEDKKKELDNAKEKLKTTAKALDKGINKDQANLFGERQSQAENPNQLFDVRVDTAERNKQLDPIKAEIKKLTKEVADLTKQRDNLNTNNTTQGIQFQNSNKQYQTLSQPAFKALIDQLKKAFSNAFKNLNVTTDWNEFVKKAKALGVSADAIQRMTVAWHGSPHNFKKFTTEAIGTGEGNQAFGWGLYFTELKSIAEAYAERLAPNKYYINGKEATSLTKDAKDAILHIVFYGYEKALNTAINLNDIPLVDEIRKLEGKEVESVKSKGVLYNVSLHKGKSPEQYTWLDWDRTIPKSIVEKLDFDYAIGGDLYNVISDYVATSDYWLNEIGIDINSPRAFFDSLIESEISGKDFYDLVTLSHYGNKKDASLALLNAGIDGVKYPAEYISRGATSDDARGFNYVVFDENAINIEEQVQFMHDSNGEVYGAKLPDGTIYLNPEKLNANTAIHEFSHLWEQLMPKAWKQGVELFKQTATGKKLFNQIKSEGNYGTNEDAIWSEALNTHIGNYGEWAHQNPKGTMGKLKDWIGKIFARIGKLFNANVDPETSLKNFTEGVLKDILGGKPIVSEATLQIAQSINFNLLSESDFDSNGNVKPEVAKAIQKEKEKIISDAKADGTYMLSPNKELTNLSEEQWVEVRTKRFKNWFGDWQKDPANASKIIDENGEPLVVYHGTTNDFNVFDSSVKGTIEGHFGRVNYFSTSYNDAEENYLKEGADLKLRIVQESSKIEDRLNEEYDFNTDNHEELFAEIISDYNITESELKERNITKDNYSADIIADILVYKEFLGDKEEIMEQFINSKNPARIGETNQWFDALSQQEGYYEQLEEVVQELADEYGISKEEVADEYQDEVDRMMYDYFGNPLVDALETALENNGYDRSKAWEILEEHYIGEAINLTDIEQKIRNAELYDNYDGEMASSQVIADFFQELGFDSIILENPSKAFRNMNIETNTQHIHVFNETPAYIKSATGNAGTYSSLNPNINFSIVTKSNPIPISTSTEVVAEIKANGLDAGLEKLKESNWYQKLRPNKQAEINSSNLVQTLIEAEQARQIALKEKNTQKVKEVKDAHEKTLTEVKKDFREKISALKDEYRKLNREWEKIEDKRQRLAEKVYWRKQASNAIILLLGDKAISKHIPLNTIKILIRKSNALMNARNIHEAFDNYLAYVDKVITKAEAKIPMDEKNQEDAFTEWEKIKDEVETSLKGGVPLADILSEYTDPERHRLALKAHDRYVAEQRTQSEIMSRNERLKKEEQENLQPRKNLSERLQAMRRAWYQRWVDRQFLPKKLLNSIGAKNTANRMVNMAGSSARAKQVYEKAYKEIYAGLTDKEISDLDDIIMYRRIIAVEEDFESKRRIPIDNPDANTKTTALGFLEGIKNKIGEAKYNKLFARSNAYFKTFNDLLTLMKDEGIISEETYNTMNGVNYNPRLFIQHVIGFDKEGLTQEENRMNMESSGLSGEMIKALEKGSYESVIRNSQALLSSAISSRYKAIMMNGVNKEFYMNELPKAQKRFASIPSDIALKYEQNIEKGKIAYGKQERFYRYYKELQDKVKENLDGVDVDKVRHYRKSYFYDNGIRFEFYMENELHEMWHDAIKGINADTKDKIATFSGSNLLKAFATGYNPAFVFVNTPRDFLHTLNFSSEYNPILAVGGVQLINDVGIAVYQSLQHKYKGKNTLLTKYIEYGGGMDFLSSQGRLQTNSFLDRNFYNHLDSKWKRRGKKTIGGLTFKGVSDISEIAFRVGAFRRALLNETKRMNKEYGTKYNSPEDIPADVVLTDKGGDTIKGQDLKDNIYIYAVAHARNLLDFNQGGVYAKNAETVMPYFNAGAQGTRVMMREFRENPYSTTAKVIQTTVGFVGATIGLGFMMLSDMDFGDDEMTTTERFLDFESTLSPYQKTNFFNIPITYDKKTKTYGTFSLAKIQGLTPAFVLAEELISNLLRREAKQQVKSWSHIMGKVGFAFTNNLDPSGLTGIVTDGDGLKSIPNTFAQISTKSPAMKAVITYATGYDFFFGQPLQDTTNGTLHQYEGVTSSGIENFYKSLGVSSGLSPVRTKAMVEGFFTSPQTNHAVGFVYGGLDAMTEDINLTDAMKGYIGFNEDGDYKISKAPVVNRLFRQTSNYSRNLNADAEIKGKEEYKKFLILEEELKSKSAKLVKEYDTFEGMAINHNAFLKEVMEFNPNPTIQEKLYNRTVNKLKKSDFDSRVYDIAYSTNNSHGAKAYLIYQYFGNIEAKPHIQQQLKEVGAWSKAVRYEYSKYVNK